MGTVDKAAPVPLARLLAMSYRWMIDRLHERLAARGWSGIRPAYGFVLLATRAGPLTPTALADKLGVSKQAASKLADALVSDGLLLRSVDGNDGRQRTLTIAPLGHELLAAVEAIYRELEAEIAAMIGPDRLSSIRNDLDTIMLTVNDGHYADLRPEQITSPRPTRAPGRLAVSSGG
jgi:DNA-binding MarR family transcriptional regulator